MQRVSTLSLFRSGELSIVDRQRDLAAAQERLSSGQRIRTPADDPLGAATAASLRSATSRFDQFKANQAHATTVLNLGETAIAQFTDTLQTIRERLIQAGGGALGNNERAQIAADLQGQLGQLVGLGNSSDGAGGYLFAGAHEQSVPFTQSGNVVSFQGDSILQAIEVSDGRFQQIKTSGDDLFLKVRAGNGSFVTAAAVANTGSASIDTGTVTNPAQLTGNNYAISFAVTGGATTYTVRNVTTNTNIATAAYTDPTDIAFDGMRVAVKGAPANGDQFTIAPAGYQSIFDTVAQAIATLQTPITNAASQAKFNTALDGALASVDQGLDHLSLRRADVGTKLAELDAYQATNDDRNLEYQARLSKIQDLDIAEGVSQLTQKQTLYQAALRSYTTVSKLSLFDYL